MYLSVLQPNTTSATVSYATINFTVKLISNFKNIYDTPELLTKYYRRAKKKEREREREVMNVSEKTDRQRRQYVTRHSEISNFSRTSRHP